MIKECKVLMWNELVMVIDYEGNKIQMPSTDKKVKSVHVKKENNKYSVISEDEYKKSLIKEVRADKKKENKSDDK